MTSGCTDLIHYELLFNCIYANNSSSEITVHCVSNNAFVSDSLFVIPVGKSHTMSDNFRPLSKYDYATISNGEKTVTHALNQQPEGIFNKSHYILVFEEPEKYRTDLLFVFDDSFFENDETTEQ